ncbi:hypothetical protein VNI00_003739 [Paramarasmius palmivorus]|uniref:FAD-binding PCMH-type domain-containing protein n=1 Tax=Paramarasmius palmivorus TaxID=297713 RepID=A0AAW0DTS8_9AGAR
MTGYTNPQWETCQSTGEQCLFDSQRDIAPEYRQNCRIGSVPAYFIDIHSEQDVLTAFRFSKEHNVSLVIKNTGHDYKGRSSAPGSLGLWVRLLQEFIDAISYERNFIPEGCYSDVPLPAVYLGAGVQWYEAFDFAEENNITLVGGSDRTVGTSGGWLQGGGHSMLSNTMGLGVDRALQFRVVTPDGQYLTANSCQNQDLFFALRGGGGGTFGVVMESTVLASPQITLQMIHVSFGSSDENLTRDLWTIMVANGLRWATEGWGGIATSNIAIYVNPNLGHDDALESIEPLLEFAERLQMDGVAKVTVITTEFSSWGRFFDWFSSRYVASVGVSLALSSRLVNKELFTTSVNQHTLVDALLEASKITPRLILMLSTPFSFHGDGQTSINEAWRSSLYHVTVASTWTWNATIDEKRDAYQKVRNSINHLRALTPDAAYVVGSLSES